MAKNNMDVLWAPWRGEFIYERPKKKCIFCVPKDKKRDDKLYILERGRYVFSILNIYPYNNGHVMVAPYRHIGSPEKLNNNELLDMMAAVNNIKKMLDEILKPEGYNIGMNVGKISGAGFDGHIHMHIVPRWAGDTNFMPVLAHTKVISDSLERLYKRMKEYLC